MTSRLGFVKATLWYLGKGVQASAMGVVAYALFVGLATENAHSELEWLLAGAALFALGLLIEKISGGVSQ
jgi:hypothetical protein